MNFPLYASEADDNHDDAPDGADQSGEDEAGVDDAGDEDDAGGDGSEDPDGIGGTDEGNQAASRRAIAERAEAERLARERGELDGERRARERAEAERQRREEEAREQAALETMTEDQRTIYLLAKQTKAATNETQATRMLVQSSTDQHKFSRTLAKKPQYAKFEDEVERRHQATLAQGGFISRDVILAHLIGERALQAENVNQQKKQGQRRIQDQRQGSRTVRGDSNGRAAGGKSVVERAEAQDWAI